MLRARGLFPTTCLSSLKSIFRENKHIKLWHIHTQTLWVRAGVAQYGFQVLGSNDSILVSQELSPLVCTTVLGEQDFSLAFHSLKKNDLCVCTYAQYTCVKTLTHSTHSCLMWICGCIWHGMHAAVRGLLCGVGSLHSPLHGFSGSNSGCHACVLSAFICWTGSVAFVLTLAGWCFTSNVS